MKLKKITLVLLLTSCIFSSPARANMQNALNSMFMSNVTSPQAYKSSTRSGFVGGGITLRTPIKPINLVAYDPPRWSAGCSGLDIYGGSFTFIDAQQFTTLLRNIMNNATGLLFKAAIAIIDPMIDGKLGEFEKIVQDLNALSSNTCAVAAAAVNAFNPKLLDEESKAQAAAVGEAMGKFTHHFSALHPDSPTQSKADSQATEDANPAAGNFTWRALHRSQVADSIGAVGMSVDPKDTKGDIPKMFLLSLIGTEIDSAYVTATNPQSTPTTQTQWGPLITLTELVGGDGLEMYTCSGAAIGGDQDALGPHSCVEYVKVPLDMANTQDYVRNMLYGDDTNLTAAGISNALKNYTAESPGPNSIYSKIVNCTTPGCSFTPQEQAFLQMSGPVFAYLKDMQYDKASIPSITKYIEDPLAVMMAQKIGQATIRAATNAWTGVKDVKMPSSVNDNIHKLEQQMATLETLRGELQDNLDQAKKISENVRKAFPVLGAQ